MEMVTERSRRRVHSVSFLLQPKTDTDVHSPRSLFGAARENASLRIHFGTATAGPPGKGVALGVAAQRRFCHSLLLTAVLELDGERAGEQARKARGHGHGGGHDGVHGGGRDAPGFTPC